MDRQKLENKILQDKKRRKESISMKFIMLIGFFSFWWIFLSWIEVIHHNDVYFSTGVDLEYSKANYFEIISLISERR